MLDTIVQVHKVQDPDSSGTQAAINSYFFDKQEDFIKMKLEMKTSSKPAATSSPYKQNSKDFQKSKNWRGPGK